MTDHDRLFKELITTFLYEFLELLLPDVAAYVEPDSLEFLDKELITDVTAGSKHLADVLVKARFRGSDACLILHDENQSDPQSDFNERMFIYYGRIYEKYRLPIYPIAVFSYDEPMRPEPNTFEIDFPDRTVLHFEYAVIQLNRMDWRDFLHRPNPVAAALMAKMRIAPEDRPIVKAECLRMIVNLPLNEARTQLLSGFVDTYLKLDAQEKVIFEEQIAEFAPQEEEKTMQIVTSWMEEGIEKGLIQGRAEGLTEGQRSVIVKLLQKRCGKLSRAVTARLEALSSAKLDELADALLDFASVNDLTAWLDTNA